MPASRDDIGPWSYSERSPKEDREDDADPGCFTAYPGEYIVSSLLVWRSAHCSSCFNSTPCLPLISTRQSTRPAGRSLSFGG